MRCAASPPGSRPIRTGSMPIMRDVAREIDRYSVTAYLDRHGLAPGDARDALEAGDPHRIWRRARGGVGARAAVQSARPSMAARSQPAQQVGRALSDLRRHRSGRRARWPPQQRAAHPPQQAPRRRSIWPRRFRPPHLRRRRARSPPTASSSPCPPTMLRELRYRRRAAAAVARFHRRGEARAGTRKLIVGYDNSAGAARSASAARSGRRANSPRPGTRSRSPPPRPRRASATSSAATQVDGRPRASRAAELARRFTAVARRGPARPAARPTASSAAPAGPTIRSTNGAYSGFAPGQLSRFASLFAVEEEGAAAACRRPAPCSSPANISPMPLPAS